MKGEYATQELTCEPEDCWIRLDAPKGMLSGSASASLRLVNNREQFAGFRAPGWELLVCR